MTTFWIQVDMIGGHDVIMNSDFVNYYKKLS
jgi:hypothetical protein